MFPCAFWHNLIMVAQRCHTHYTHIQPWNTGFLPVVIWNDMIDFRATKFSWQLPNLPLKLQGFFFQPNPVYIYTVEARLDKDLGSQFEKLIQEFDLSPFGKKRKENIPFPYNYHVFFCSFLLSPVILPFESTAWRVTGYYVKTVRCTSAWRRIE